jgi:hypothetical protein
MTARQDTGRVGEENMLLMGVLSHRLVSSNALQKCGFGNNRGVQSWTYSLLIGLLKWSLIRVLQPNGQ